MQEHILELMENNKKLLYDRLHTWHLIDDPEAESIGYYALYRAAEEYDGREGVKFSTYAYVCIYNAIGSYIRTLHRKRRIKTISYNAPVTEGLEHISLFPDSFDMEQYFVDIEEHKETTQMLYDVFVELYNELKSETHKKILYTWVKYDFSISKTEIAKIVGVSQAHTSQIFAVLLNKLKLKIERWHNDQQNKCSY